MRIGQGFDAHRFIQGRSLIVGGVTIPYPLGLDAHSDGDVLIHAVCDALLGAAALGDIGRHFPDTETTFAQIDSRILLRKIRLLLGSSYKIVNLDATLLGEAPRFAPFIAQMRQHLAQDLEIMSDCVSVKATTTEHMGFLGRQEGLAALAVVLIEESQSAIFSK